MSQHEKDQANRFVMCHVTHPASFIKIITNNERSFLGSIIIICESAVLMHTPETKLSLSSGWKKAKTRLHQGKGLSEPAE